MRGTLIGTDYLYQGDDVKVLEINTNTAIISKGVEHLDLNPFFQFLQGWEFSEFHFIYSEAMTIGRDGDSTIFLDTLQQRCDDIGITFVKHEVDADTPAAPLSLSPLYLPFFISPSNPPRNFLHNTVFRSSIHPFSPYFGPFFYFLSNRSLSNSP
mgnify:CR=1 FL=1